MVWTTPWGGSSYVFEGPDDIGTKDPDSSTSLRVGFLSLGTDSVRWGEGSGLSVSQYGWTVYYSRGVRFDDFVG